LSRLGAIPIFEHLRRRTRGSLLLGVLTGTIIIIPTASLEKLRRILTHHSSDDLTTVPLSYDEHYVLIRLNEKIQNAIVYAVTKVFEGGGIEVLVGTTSLLGEGWDAPAINSLVLASTVGSYMLSNQMRGRAIRTLRDDPEKTANIWHLVCIDPTAEEGGDDLQLMERRFKAFVGVSHRENGGIENGIGRLDLPTFISSPATVEHTNERMLASAVNRERLGRRWKEALEKGTTQVEEIKIPFVANQNYRGVTSLHYRKTIAYIIGELVLGLMVFGQGMLRGLADAWRGFQKIEDLFIWVTAIGVAGMIVLGGKLIKTFRICLKYRDIAEDVHGIGEALVESLIIVGSIHTERSRLKVVSHKDDRGAVYCHLEGGTTYEQSIFISSLMETIGVVNNPRYVIARLGVFLRLISQKDYHSVPESIGRRKEFAEHFQQQWEKYVGPCRLIYTRMVEGRKLLLRSRFHSLASEFEGRSERVSLWR
jgi:hypothetical protein